MALVQPRYGMELGKALSEALGLDCCKHYIRSIQLTVPAEGFITAKVELMLGNSEAAQMAQTIREQGLKGIQVIVAGQEPCPR